LDLSRRDTITNPISALPKRGSLYFANVAF
jgi:hypothetical protein